MTAAGASTAVSEEALLVTGIRVHPSVAESAPFRPDMVYTALVEVDVAGRVAPVLAGAPVCPALSRLSTGPRR